MTTKGGRTAFLVDQLGGGGAQRSAILVASALQARGVSTLLIAARDGSYMRDIARALPIRLLSPKWPRLTSLPGFARELRRVVARDDITTIVAGGFTIGRMALLLRWLRVLHEARVVVVEHNTLSLLLVERFPNRLLRAVVRRLTRWLYRRADAIVGVSDGVSRDLETALGLPTGTVATIYNPVDVDRITAAIEEAVAEPLATTFASLPRPVVITTGRLVEQKVQQDLLVAFAELPEEQRGSLVILGEGPLRADLERQARALGIDRQVWLPGFVDNPWWFMARSDVFALPSRHEGHPLVLLEALACGLPIVSTDCPSGPREILAGISAARLVPVGDTDAMTHAIEELLRIVRPTEHADVGRYDPTHVAEQYVQVIVGARCDQCE